jgi:hypothetical protein
LQASTEGHIAAHIAAQFTEQLLPTASGRITGRPAIQAAATAATAIRATANGSYSYGYPAYSYSYPAYGCFRPALYGGYRVARRVAIHRARWQGRLKKAPARR